MALPWTTWTRTPDFGPDFRALRANIRHFPGWQATTTSALLKSKKNSRQKGKESSGPVGPFGPSASIKNFLGGMCPHEKATKRKKNKNRKCLDQLDQMDQVVKCAIVSRFWAGGWGREGHFWSTWSRPPLGSSLFFSLFSFFPSVVFLFLSALPCKVYCGCFSGMKAWQAFDLGALGVGGVVFTQEACPFTLLNQVQSTHRSVSFPR